MSLYNKLAATHLRIKQKVWPLAGKNEGAMAKDQPKQMYTIDQLLDGQNNTLFEGGKRDRSGKADWESGKAGESGTGPILN